MNPPSVDLRPQVDSVEDQGQEPECMGFGNTEAVEIMHERAGNPDLQLSPDYLYYYAQLAEKRVGTEGVRDMQDIANVLLNRGCCLLSSWGFTPDHYAQQPPASLDAEAAQYKIKSATRLDMFCPQDQRIAKIKKAVAQGYAVPIAQVLTMDFCNAHGPWREQKIDWHSTLANPGIGTHCTVVIGYDDATNGLLAQNSWGPNWGDGGFYKIDYTAPILLDAFMYDAGVPVINAGWTPDPVDMFNALADWAERTGKIPSATSPTQKFMQYFYRQYGEVDYGLDTNTMHVVQYYKGKFVDEGPITDWLAKITP